MECGRVRELAEAFTGDQLSIDTTEVVVAHLERCPACREEVEGLRRLRTAMRSAFDNAPDLAVRLEFLTALPSRLQAKAVQRPSRMPRRTWLTLAASAVLATAAGWGWREWSRAGLPDLLRLAVGDHRFCALSFKLAEQPIPLEEAARRYGGINALLQTVEPSVTTLTNGPLRIVERHSCVFEGQRFVHIVLRYKNEAVSLLIADDPVRAPWGPDAIPSALPATDGFHIATFRGGRHAVFVVSSLADADVQEVAQAMAGPITQALAGA